MIHVWIDRTKLHPFLEQNRMNWRPREQHDCMRSVIFRKGRNGRLQKTGIINPPALPKLPKCDFLLRITMQQFQVASLPLMGVRQEL